MPLLYEWLFPSVSALVLVTKVAEVMKHQVLYINTIKWYPLNFSQSLSITFSEKGSILYLFSKVRVK